MSTQLDVLRILSEDNNCAYLNDLASVHLLTKHYLLIAEEIAPEGTLLLQPLKEHRDAYEHLTRIFSLAVRTESDLPESVEYYIHENLDKAFGHEYRAFFDTVDWLTYMCRKYIRETLSQSTVRIKYSSQFDFSYTQKFINDLPFKIAKYREKKDVSNNKNRLLNEVHEYKEVIEELITIMKNVQTVEF